MASINTNSGALQALQARRGSTGEASAIQRRLSTGLRVAGTKDDSAAYVTAQGLRGEAATWLAAGRNIARARSVVDVAVGGTEQISDLPNQLKAKALELSVDNGSGSGSAIQRDMVALIQQIDTVANTAEFGGLNLLKGKPSINTVTTRSYSLDASTAALTGGSPMSALPAGTTLRDTSSYAIAPSPLTPGTFGAALASLSGGGAADLPVDAGPNPGRVVMLADAFGVPDDIEIWQGGVRVAASGQLVATGGAAVGPAQPVSGQHLLQFDYDPAKGQSLTVKVNPNGAVPGTAWEIEAFELQDPDDPVGSNAIRSTSQLVISAATEPPLPQIDPEQAIQIQQTPPTNGSARYARNLGPQPGRVDTLFGAFGVGDVMEVWQDGVRIAATGQAYTPGGGAVASGSAVSGQQIVSFDYDPARGSVSYVFNPDGADPASAWVVAGISLNDPSDPIPAALATAVHAQAPGVSPVNYDIVVSPRLQTERLSTRGLGAADLGLGSLNWSSPRSILGVIEAAERTVGEALSHFGSQHRQFSMQGRFASGMQDVLEAGIGKLVDADLAKEAARLQAGQVRQQLVLSALSIANSQPRTLLSLFE